MDDSKLQKLSLVLAIIGVVALFVLTQALQPEKIGLSEIRGDFAGRVVVVDADVGKVNQKNDNIFLTLQDGDTSLKAVYWASDAKNNPEAYELAAGDAITATGQVAVYRGELEIIIKKILRQ